MAEDQSASRSDDADDGIAALERLKANFCWSDSRDAGTAFQKAKDCFARAIDTEIEYLRTVARSEQQPINKLPRDSMVIDPLPEMVMEAIDAYGRYYAEQYKLGMSVRDDMKYIASVAIRSVTGGDGGLDISQELRSVLAWEAKRMGRVSAGVLKSVIKRLEDLLPASTQNQSNERHSQ